VDTRHAFLIPAAALVAATALAAACNSVGESACFESGATAYPVNLPGDTVSFRWPAGYYPVRYYAEPAANLAAHADNGLQLWLSAFRCGELQVQRITDSTQADVIIRNPAQFPAVIGVSFAADSVGACQGRTDVALDSLHRLLRPVRVYVVPFSLDPVAVEACYQFVTAHEIGHTLGLFQHSPNPADLMYSVPRHTAISLDDRYTVQLLYHFNAPIQPEPR
jgi:hypothetical protein